MTMTIQHTAATPISCVKAIAYFTVAVYMIAFLLFPQQSYLHVKHYFGHL